MRIFLKTSVLLAVLLLFKPAFSQKNISDFEKKYREAEVLENNAIYDIAKKYYIESFETAKNTKQHKNIQNKIKQKIVLMSCYEMFYHLINQAQELELLMDFESAAKYYSDALSYARYENLKIQDFDSIQQRINLVSRTSNLCKNLQKVNFFNENEQYTDAKVLFAELKAQSTELQSYWNKYGFQETFIREFDSLCNFLSYRHIAQKYRHYYTTDFNDIDNHFLNEISKAACLLDEDFETDISFSFSLDTNGIVNRQVDCPHHNTSFADSLYAALYYITIQQPHRYGYSLPTEDAIVHHIISTKEQFEVKKSKGKCKTDNLKYNTLVNTTISEHLLNAPNGKYYFINHKNEIDGRISIHTQLVKAKGGKARKWLKNIG